MNKYCILGSGRQGTAAAYDIAKFGSASKIIMADVDVEVAKAASNRVNNLCGSLICEFTKIDVSDSNGLKNLFKDCDLVISCVPYFFNLEILEIAISTKTHMVDLGGHTGITRKQLSMHSKAKSAGVVAVPDCGMGPGMNITMSLLALEKVENGRHVYIWDGGLPQRPVEPWNYALFFNINGLTNEYDGSAYFIDCGKVREFECFSDYELIDFEGVGTLEAAVTSGGLSTMPWTYEDRLSTLRNKTLRYKGHWEQMKGFRNLGLFRTDTVKFGNKEIVPREFYHHLLEQQLIDNSTTDVCMMRVDAFNEDKSKGVRVEAVERFDQSTGFSAMEKWTGWHASIMAIHIINKKIDPGVVSVENALHGSDFFEESKKRNYNISINNLVRNKEEG